MSETNHLRREIQEMRSEMIARHKDFEAKFFEMQANYNRDMLQFHQELAEHRVKTAGIWGKITGIAMGVSVFVSYILKKTPWV